MPDFETAISSLEESLRHFGQNCKFQKTGSPNIFCTTLPPHWRSNKSLPSPFVVLILSPVADGTRVTVTAGNEENDTADVKNHVTEVTKQIARFSDLRFVGKSGRGKNFNLTITIHHNNDYREIAVVPSVIKVTVDGPRDSRNASKCPYNPFDYRKRPATLTPFDLPLNLGVPHSLPSTSGLFDLTNSSAKRPRMNSNNNNVSVNNIQNPIISNGNEFFKSSQISMPSIPSHLHPQLQLQHQILPFQTNLNFMMAAAAAIQQQQQQHHQQRRQQQQPFIQQNMYNAYLTLCAAALASSINPPSSSETSSTDFEIKSEMKLEVESCKATPTPPPPPPTTNVSSPLPSQEEGKTRKRSEEKKVWRPFLSTE